MIASLTEQIKSLTAREAYHAVLDHTKYVEKLKIQDTPEAQARIENLEELDSAISEFEKERGDEATLSSFLEEIALVTDADKHDVENQNAVTLMTLHISKGLEFPVVFIVGLEDGLFPSARSLGEEAQGDGEEERRLFYVGMTRARKRLFLTYARMRKVWGADQMYPPSRFLGEIPGQYIERVSKVLRPISTWQSSTPSWDDAVPEFDSHADDDSGDDLRKGMKVRHPSYGVGVVYTLEGSGEDQKVTILFPNKSMKKFVVKFARLERV
jgi:DNA helicase-2/ATP-dependent DNA helicase PcrA